MTGAIIAFTSLAIFRAIVRGAVISAPLLITPCGSRVPVGRITVLILAGTTSLNSIQLISLISLVETVSDVCATAWIAAMTRKEIDRTKARNILNPPDDEQDMQTGVAQDGILPTCKLQSASRSPALCLRGD